MIKICSFNAENLFARYRFKDSFDPIEDNGFSINNTAFSINNATSKRITAQAIKEVDADVLALQEIENLRVLDRFVSEYLASMGYKHRILIDSMDPRGIDVALLSRHPIVHTRSYRQAPNPHGHGRVFSRDCLEVDIDIDGKSLTLYVNHFKSMSGGRDETHQRRKNQADKVMAIIDERWKGDGYKGNYVVLGDLNDYLDSRSSLSDLMSFEGLVNVSEQISEDDRWTHYWKGGNEYRQLDYILLSPILAATNPNQVPKILRKGMPYRAEKYEGDRYDGVGEDNPKASDHCPITIEIKL